MGNLTINLADLPRGRAVERWYRLNDAASGRICLSLKAVGFGRTPREPPSSLLATAYTDDDDGGIDAFGS